MNRFIYAFLAFLALAGCGGAVPETPPLQGAKMGGAFTLTNQDGQQVSDSAFAGQYRLVYFGFSFCPDVCPLDLQRLMAGLKALEKSDAKKAAQIQPLFISVDPARDTPAVIKTFVAAFHPRLVGLTGSEARIADVAKRYGAYFEKGEKTKDGGYLVNHSTNAVLYGPKGEPLAIIAQDAGADKIGAELARWVK